MKVIMAIALKFRLNQIDLKFIIAFFAALLLELVVAWYTPPFAIPDEGAHYLRSFEVSRGHFINSQGNVGVSIPCVEYLVVAKQYAPVAFYQSNAEAMRPNSKECAVNSVNTAGAYPAIPYIAAALGIRIGEYFASSVETRLKFGRMANAIVTSIICLVSVLLVQRYRLLLSVLIFIPMCVWLRASLSADALTISLGIFYLAYILRLDERSLPILTRHVVNLSILGVLMGSVKPVYGLLCFTSLILITNPISWRAKLIEASKLGCPGFCALAIGSIWVMKADSSLVYINHFGGADPGLQLRYVLNDPGNFAQTIAATFSHNFYSFVTQAFLPTIAAKDWLPQIDRAVFSLFVSFLVGFTMLTTGANFRVWQRSLILGITFICLVVVVIPSYLTYTLVGFNEILGLQGRYFLPILFFMVVAVSLSRPKIFFADDQIRFVVAVVIPILFNAILVSSYVA